MESTYNDKGVAEIKVEATTREPERKKSGEPSAPPKLERCKAHGCEYFAPPNKDGFCTFCYAELVLKKPRERSKETLAQEREPGWGHKRQRRDPIPAPRLLRPDEFARALAIAALDPEDAPFRAGVRVGDAVDACDHKGIWYRATVLARRQLPSAHGSAKGGPTPKRVPTPVPLASISSFSSSSSSFSAPSATSGPGDEKLFAGASDEQRAAKFAADFEDALDALNTAQPGNWGSLIKHALAHPEVITVPLFLFFGVHLSHSNGPLTCRACVAPVCAANCRLRCPVCGTRAVHHPSDHIL